MLLESGEVPISPSTFGNYRRSSAIGAILASIPGTEIVRSSPARVRLTPSAPLCERLEEACSLIAQPRHSSVVTAGDQFHDLMGKALPEAVLLYLDRAQNLKVQGSAGQLNFLWAETPWVAVMNRLVTESPQRGHYLAFLVDAGGRGVYLSLNQGITKTDITAQWGYSRQYLAQRAEHFRGYLAKENISNLILQSIDLAGNGGRTRGYASASIAAVFFEKGTIPHDAVLGTELRRFLSLYQTVTASLDEEQAELYPDIPPEARGGTESKRYRWHLRAEGRNSAVARQAKQLQGYACQVCERDFEKELGELGKRCIEAHHLAPFEELDDEPRDLDPEEDFAVVCANCHRMLHSETPPLSPERLARRIDVTGSR
jgi:5-methylcytosine-specific restriction enzyme A